MSTEKVVYASAEEERRWNSVRVISLLSIFSIADQAFSFQAKYRNEFISPVVQG